MRRIIYSFWLEGRDQAPPLVRFCLERWTQLNPRYEVQLFDRARAQERLVDFPICVDDLSPQALSDVLRCCLLREGGVWVDAATLPITPLDAWLEAATRPTGFFAFEAPSDRPLASWFIAATEHHQLVELWWDAVSTYWHRPRRLATVPGERFIVPTDPVASVSPPAAEGSIYPYFWFHYLFRLLIETDAEASHLWRSTPRISSLPPHALQLLCRSNPEPTVAAIASAVRGTAVQKLDWRQSYPIERLKLVLRRTPSTTVRPVG